MKKICALMLALILLFSMATSAAALEYKAIARQSGMCALAGWTDMDEDTITSTDLVAIKTPVGTFVFLSISTFDTMTGSGSYKSGYIFTRNNVFHAAGNLNSARLSAVDIEVSDLENYETEIITVKANWAGKGETLKGSSKFISKSGDCIIKSSDSSSYREATATASIDNLDAGENCFAELVSFKSTSMEMKK
ncbi:hypothetical protein [Methanosarcina sp.]|uniref:hypothetical protein n=1 Tax=Methanosarcina sp. TaxID=2213 RepID=UPI002ABBA9D8|nr:hypothetical protein [Methanosarcina sp.]MDY9926839.1 hypothetical protein [Methanosarcina sp.]